MTDKYSLFHASVPTLIGVLLFALFANVAYSQSEVLACWRFEQIRHLNNGIFSTTMAYIR